MGLLTRLLFLAVAASPLVVYLFANDRLFPAEDPALYAPKFKWFGKGEKPQQSSVKIEPFKVRVNQKELDGLKQRIELDMERLAPPMPGVGFGYGFNTDYLKDLLGYWKDSFDWRKVEKQLNSFDQFRTNIAGLDVHFIHAKPNNPKGKTVLPLLLVHGWPGSVLEFMKILPILTEPSNDSEFVFEVIAPSIPGYGFSSAPMQEGFDAAQCAKIFIDLMRRLGHDRFYTQAGDWGSVITAVMATVFPQHVIGYHTNFPAVNTLGSTLKKFIFAQAPSFFVDKQEEVMLKDLGEQYIDALVESGYFHIQATKPDTLGVGLNASPAGMAAWLLEKFSTATDKDFRKRDDGGLTEKFTKDELLADVTLYWLTKSGATAGRFYLENMGRRTSNTNKISNLPITVPTGLAVFPHEIAVTPKAVLENRYRNIVTHTIHPRGGHFAALEEPVLLAKDFRKFVEKVEAKRDIQFKRVSEL